MTRSIVSLAHGDVAASLAYHPLGVVLATGLLAGLGGGLLGRLRGRDPFWEFLERRGTWVAVLLLAGLLAVWVARTFAFPEWSPNPIGEPRPVQLLWPAPLPR